MKRFSLTLILVLSCCVCQGQTPAEFSTPGDQYRPWIFWDWMEDMVTTRGITSDLEQFQKFGLRGTLIMLIGNTNGDFPIWKKSNIPHPVPSQSPEFFSMWKYAAEESARLGLTISTQLGPGWCHSGGPFVKPDQAVQHIAFTETDSIKGPVPNAKFVMSERHGKGRGYHSVLTDRDDPRWVQVDLGKSFVIDKVNLVPYKNGKIDGFGFPIKFRIEVASNPDFSDARVFYESPHDQPNPGTKPISLEGPQTRGRYVRITATKNYSVFRQNKTQYLFSLAEIEIFSAGHNVALNEPVVAATSIEKFDYTTASLTDGFEAAGAVYHAGSPYELARPGYDYFTSDVAVVAFPEKAVVEPSEVIELTTVSKNGEFIWSVPPGNWKVRRYAMQNAQAYNRAAPVAGRGLECDKLDKDAVDAEFEGMVGRYLKDSPGLVGKTIRGFEADSWEVGNPEWSEKFRGEFIKRRGYDPVPWLISYKTDQVVGNVNLTRRFRDDMILTQSDLFADNFFSHLADKAKRLGMQFLTEAYTGPFDPIRCGGRATVPMGEFWVSGDALTTVRWMGSAAHTYGRSTVAAEAFTGRWSHGTWNSDLYCLKRIGDLAFCNGANKMVLHGTGMQPWALDVKPGIPLFDFGTMFSPGQTWWEPGRKWVDYLTRCQYMLGQGRSVADVAALIPNVHWQKSTPSGLHKKHDYDLVSEESLINDMDWKDGSFVLRSGAKYRVLLLPLTHGEMEPAILKKLIELVTKGGIVVCQDRPSASASLAGYPGVDQEVKELAQTLWGDCDGVSIREHRLGNGRLVWLKNVWKDVEDPEKEYYLRGTTRNAAFWGTPQVTTHWSPGLLKLLSSIVEPDVSVIHGEGRSLAMPGRPETACGTRTGEDAVAWLHRVDGDNDIYFLASQVADPDQVQLSFRVNGKVSELWFPDTGVRSRPEQWHDDGRRTQMTLPMDPFGSVFVVFKPKPSSMAEWNALPVYKPAGVSVVKTVPLDGEWNVTFPEKLGAPPVAKLHAGSWTSSTVFGIKYFSGTATYSTDFQASTADLQSSVSLDLGEVKNFAEIIVNGKSVVTLWKPPFRADITGYLKPGANRLEVKVTNTWWNRMVGDEQLPEDLEWGPNNLNPKSKNDWKGHSILEIPKWVWSGAQRPSKDRVTFTTWRFVEKDSPLQPSGLIGPVRLVLSQNN